MAPQSIEFWQQHSLNFLEMAFRTDKRERIQHPDGYGRREGSCGDWLEIFLTVRDERLAIVSFESNGCVHTLACANTVVMLAEGRTVAEAWAIDADQVIAYLKTLPAAEYHCAERAVQALQLALASLQESKRTPWKKLYAPQPPA